MSEPFSVECASCFVSFKLKDRKLIGKKIRCPKCKEPILVKDAAQVADDWLGEDVETKAAPAAPRGLPPKVGQSAPKAAKNGDSEKKPRPSKASAGSGMAFDVFMWVVGGLIGGGLGALGWGLIVSKTGFEIKYAAWGVGALAGGGVRLFSRKHEGTAPGLTAAAIGLCAIVLGKYLAWQMFFQDFREEIGPVTDDQLISIIADDIVTQREDAGTPLEWPDEDSEGDDLGDYYPDGIWEEATTAWNAKSKEEQEEMRDKQNAIFTDLITADVGMLYLMFDLIDFIWIPLAVGTAYKVGAGMDMSGD